MAMACRAAKVLLLLCLQALIQVHAGEPTTYIVRMDKDEMPTNFEQHEHWYGATLAAAKASLSPLKASSVEAVSLGGVQDELIHVYDTAFHGFAAKMTKEEAEALESQPGVVMAIPDTKKLLHTTHSPTFLRLNSSWGIWPASKYGDDVIVGVFDTGVWPESESFRDVRMTPVPKRWKGICQAGPGFKSTSCNNKLVGARYFFRGYEAMSGPINGSTEFKSPRDSDGHGTHTASTAAGVRVEGASMLGFAAGVAQGMAPAARVAVYKVCWTSGCFDSDILAAFDAAVADGVDVISLSVGGGVMPYYLDSIALGSFAAMRAGVFVATSGGNQGPGELSVTNIAPWIATVGASTMDRAFPAEVTLGSGENFHGVSLYSGKRTLGKRAMVPVVYAGDCAVGKNGSDGYSASLCMAGSLDPNKVKGKIVLCDRGSNARVEKGGVVLAAGGRGMILANSAADGEGLIADAHLLPASAVGYSAGQAIRRYARSGSTATATIKFQGTVTGTAVPAPVVASFSSRGPNPETAEVLKPDVIAPGVNILAAWSGAAGPTGLPTDQRRVGWNIISGTSMACPHVSGVAALLKAEHPKWSPAAVKSALMTSAILVDNRRNVMADEATGNVSTPFDFGSGLVDPEGAMDPGLVYDMGENDYVAFLCALNYSAKAVRMVTRDKAACPSHRRPRISDLNYPSFSAVFDLSTKGPLVATFRRTVTNVGPARSTYVSSLVAPRGVQATVSPKTLEFTSQGQALTYTLTIKASRVAVMPGESESVFGLLTWSDDKHLVKSPIAVSWQEPY